MEWHATESMNRPIWGRADGGSYFVTRDPHDSIFISHLTCDPCDLWPITYDSWLTTTHESRLLPFLLCNQHAAYLVCTSQSEQFFGIQQRLKTSLEEHNLKENPLTSTSAIKLWVLFLEIGNLVNLIMGQRSRYWPLTNVTHPDLLAHLTHDPLTHCQLWFGGKWIIKLKKDCADEITRTSLPPSLSCIDSWGFSCFGAHDNLFLYPSSS